MFIYRPHTAWSDNGGSGCINSVFGTLNLNLQLMLMWLLLHALFFSSVACERKRRRMKKWWKLCECLFSFSSAKCTLWNVTCGFRHVKQHWITIACDGVRRWWKSRKRGRGARGWTLNGREWHSLLLLLFFASTIKMKGSEKKKKRVGRQRKAY